MDELNSLVDFLSGISETINFNNLNLNIFIINILSLLVGFILYYDIKIRLIFKEKKYLMLLLIMIALDFLIECVFNDLILLVPLLSFFIVNIIFFLKSRDDFDFFNNKGKEKKSIKKDKGNEELDDIRYKINKLGKDDDFNIIDILYLYDYITDYQRRKLIQNMICESVDNMIDYLLNNPVITQEELKEATAIHNLIDFNGRLVTKDEVNKYLVKNVENDKENKKNKEGED